MEDVDHEAAAAGCARWEGKRVATRRPAGTAAGRAGRRVWRGVCRCVAVQGRYRRNYVSARDAIRTFAPNSRRVRIRMCTRVRMMGLPRWSEIVRAEREYRAGVGEDPWTLDLLGSGTWRYLDELAAAGVDARGRTVSS